MFIRNSGILAPFGYGVECFKSAIAHGGKFEYNEYTIGKKQLLTKRISPKLRRADRFTKMSVIAAHDALTGRPELEGIDRSRVGIIMCTAFGPHATTFKFLDDILQFGDDNASAITFSHSVHNAAASYIALALGITGPTTTLTQFHNPFEHGIMLAECWLNENRCDYILLCMCDERGQVFDYIAQQKLEITETPKSFDFDTQKVTPSEGSVALLLQREKEEGRCELKFSNSDEQNIPRIFNSNGTSRSIELPTNQPCYNLSPCYGTLLGSVAFDIVFATLLLENPQLEIAPELQRNITTEKYRSIQCQGGFNLTVLKS
jgi:3-oxoacyl-[acyl-carrier-protein] synthase II